LYNIRYCSKKKHFRLTGPTRCSGRVEVFFNSSWGTVCDDGWDLTDAAVVCRLLGCGLPQTALSGAHFGEGTGQIWLSNVGCSGLEDTLTECSHSGFGINSCGHAQDAGVICGKFLYTSLTRTRPEISFSYGGKPTNNETCLV
uniref:Soluble scavenger receptor cysteine-rich domain-containing protein SSC5D n=1 Tax=Fundulus heteroclitus TaxID=8078 RepID=A0A3Q2QXS4_FUNHE